MSKYHLELTEDQISYYENLDCEKLIEDMEMTITINNSFDIDPFDIDCDEFNPNLTR